MTHVLANTDQFHATPKIMGRLMLKNKQQTGNLSGKHVAQYRMLIMKQSILSKKVAELITTLNHAIIHTNHDQTRKFAHGGSDRLRFRHYRACFGWGCMCCVVLCVLCCVVLYCVVLCCIVLCCVVLCCVVTRYAAVLLWCVVLCCVVICCGVVVVWRDMQRCCCGVVWCGVWWAMCFWCKYTDIDPVPLSVTLILSEEEPPIISSQLGTLSLSLPLSLSLSLSLSNPSILSLYLVHRDKKSRRSRSKLSRFGKCFYHLFKIQNFIRKIAYSFTWVHKNASIFTGSLTRTRKFTPRRTQSSFTDVWMSDDRHQHSLPLRQQLQSCNDIVELLLPEKHRLICSPLLNVQGVTYPQYGWLVNECRLPVWNATWVSKWLASCSNSIESDKCMVMTEPSSPLLTTTNWTDENGLNFRGEWMTSANVMRFKQPNSFNPQRMWIGDFSLVRCFVSYCVVLCRIVGCILLHAACCVCACNTNKQTNY